jgi:hypothetical protein
MKTKTTLGLLATVFLSTFNAQLSTAFAQGSLAPPGAPAPTMRTLLQIEPRTPISSVPFVISTPGSYYLTTNITSSTGDAIDIAANGVTLDLNGFTISSTLDPANGIAIGLNTGVSDITILNGHVVSGVTNNVAGGYSGSGFGYGIYGPSVSNVRVAGVSVVGCRYDGINLNPSVASSTTVESCTVRTVGGYGIVADTVSHSIAYQCANYAIFAIETASDCYGNSTSSHGVDATTANNCYGVSGGNGDGVTAFTAINCFGSSASGRGVVASTANNCFGSSSSGIGLEAGNGIGCYGNSSTGTGLNANIANSCNGTGSPGVMVTYKYNMP